MKPTIHPALKQLQAVCSCGNQFQVMSSHKQAFRLDVCNQCHPFFTGKHRIVDAGGRVDRFKKRFGNSR